ncbi:MAG: hypothetical protein AAFR61_09775 [Bacteroidota bacterium]
MQNSRLISLIKLLSPGELRRFTAFVHSPFFNQQEKVRHLWQLISDTGPHFSGPDLSKEILYESLFQEPPNTSYQPLHDQMSLLLRLFELFLATRQFLQNEDQQSQNLLQGLISQGESGDHVSRVYEKSIRKLDQAAIKDHRYYLRRYELMTVEDHLSSQQRRGWGQDYGQRIEQLDIFYVATKLRYVCEILNRKGLAGAENLEEKIREIEELFSHLTEEGQQLPTIQLYYQVFNMLAEPEVEGHYQKLVKLLRQNVQEFSQSEAYNLYAYAQNYCIKKINKGSAKYQDELFQLYKILLQEGLLIEGGTLAHAHFKNITTLGLRMQDYDWVREFLSTYKDKLLEPVRESAYTYNLASYYYETKDYKAAMKLLQQVDFTDVFYDLSGRVMLLKIFYEISDWDSIRYATEAFKGFLKRHKEIPKSYHQLHYNFLMFVRKLARLNQQNKRQDPADFLPRWEKAQQSLKEQPQIAQRKWIEDKLRYLRPLPA